MVKPHKKTFPVLTIGHSTLALAALIAALKAHGAERLVDIRTIPRSRHNPQFNQENLATALPEAGIGYDHSKGLGGLRRPRPDSPNGGWRNAGFRGFADYMQTAEFAAELDRLIEAAASERLVLMCAEAVPWRCHRSLVADALTLRGVPVAHIMSAEASRPHKLTPFAEVRGSEITYPPEQGALL
jgi:uncharacterized protein (DUF488 family)